MNDASEHADAMGPWYVVLTTLLALLPAIWGRRAVVAGRRLRRARRQRKLAPTDADTNSDSESDADTLPTEGSGSTSQASTVTATDTEQGGTGIDTGDDGCVCCSGAGSRAPLGSSLLALAVLRRKRRRAAG